MAIVWRLLLLWVNFAQVFPLRCLQCVGTNSSCRMVARKCPSYETTCISLAYRTKDGRNTVMKGCSTTDLCNQTSIIDTDNQSMYMTASCCESDYCNINRFSTSQVFSNRLTCNACNSSSLSCNNMVSVDCDEVNNNCVDIVTTETNTITGTSRSTYVKGCGSSNIGDQCTNLFAYSTLNYQRYTYLSCCSGQNCNSPTQSIPILNNNNGITCYSCKDNGNNECATQNQTTVQCKGTLLRCMEAFDKNRRTIIKGCSTVSYCSSTDLSQKDPDVAEIMCCAGSLCNNFTREISSTVITPSSTAIRNTDFSILAVFLCLIFFVIGH